MIIIVFLPLKNVNVSHLVPMMKPATEVGVVGVREILMAANVKNVRMDITVPMISAKVIHILDKNTNHPDWHY